MAPESLVDGVFTCQSDVWAFGVLIWEIMTLGQQPYPARTNLEVLHYVRNGGRLGRPNNCPEELYVAKYISISCSLMYKKTVCMIVQDSIPSLSMCRLL
jgi:Protein tyrosine kinase.